MWEEYVESERVFGLVVVSPMPLPSSQRKPAPNLVTVEWSKQAHDEMLKRGRTPVLVVAFRTRPQRASVLTVNTRPHGPDNTGSNDERTKRLLSKGKPRPVTFEEYRDKTRRDPDDDKPTKAP